MRMIPGTVCSVPPCFAEQSADKNEVRELFVLCFLRLMQGTKKQYGGEKIGRHCQPEQ